MIIAGDGCAADRTAASALCLSRHEEGFQVSAESIVQRTKTVLEVEGDPSRVLPRCVE